MNRLLFKSNFITAVLLLLFSISFSLSAADTLEVFHKISSHDLLEYAKELTSEKFKGRLAGTPEYFKSAEWIAGLFNSWGIKPAGDSGTYFQYFKQPYTEVKSPGKLVIHKNKKIICTCPADYYPGANSASGSISGEAVFVGYGISAPELNYDDYKNVSVKNKIVIMLPDIPYSKNDSGKIKWVPYSYTRMKFENAIKHGAKGVLYIGKIANPNTPYVPGLIYSTIEEKLIDSLFFGENKKLNSIKNSIQNKLQPVSFNTNIKVTMSSETKHFPNAFTANVIGVIEGYDPILKDEVIIYAAHLDGQGKAGVLFPSALDNASGVVDILGAAKALSEFKGKLKRSVAFLFFSGEETGLIGSKFYCDNPVFKKEKTLFFNIDMAGNGTGLFLWGGKSHPEINEVFVKVNEKYLHRNFKNSEARASVSRPRSDGEIFIRAGYKTLGFGTTERQKEIYYHNEKDNIEALTPEILEDIAKWIYLSTLQLADFEKL